MEEEEKRMVATVLNEMVTRGVIQEVVDEMIRAVERTNGLDDAKDKAAEKGRFRTDPKDSAWLVVFKGDSVSLRELTPEAAQPNPGSVLSSYAPMPRDWATVALCAISQGFVPPRDRRGLGTPAD